MTAFLGLRTMARMSKSRDKCCGSSVVEHTLGKGEVESSILSHSTIKNCISMVIFYLFEYFYTEILVSLLVL